MQNPTTTRIYKLKFHLIIHQMFKRLHNFPLDNETINILTYFCVVHAYSYILLKMLV